MAAKRMTLHSGRYNASPKHNDRTFDLEKADHIDIGRLDENYYWECASGKTSKGSPAVSFETAELQHYTRYQGAIDAQNAKNEAQRHKERNTNTVKYHKSKKTMPDEEIFQIGKKDNAASLEIWNIYSEYLNWHRKRYPNVKILDIALHMDEATPHIHARKVWEYTDENGNIAVGQAKALEEMEVERPDPSKPVSRNNNAKMTYTAECREKMMELCKAKGYELITEPEKRPKSKQNLQKLEYVTEKLMQENQALSQENQKCRNEIEQLKSEKTALTEGIQQLYKQTLVLQDDVGKLKNEKDFISMKFRGFVAQMDYFLKNMHDMTDAEIQRRSNAFMRDYDDIRDEIDEIGIEMD